MTLFETEYRATIIADKAQKRKQREIKSSLEVNTESILVVTLKEFMAAADDGKAGILSDTIMAAKQIAKIAGDYGFNKGQFYYHIEKDWIVLKGYAGLRKFLTRPHYSINHWKVLEMGIGVQGVKHVSKEFLKKNILFSVAYSVLESILGDEAGLSFLVANVSTAVIKSYIAGMAGSIVVAKLGIAATAIGAAPIVATLAIGIGIAVALEYLDNKFGLTDKLARKLSEVCARIAAEHDRSMRKAAKSYYELEQRIIWELRPKGFSNF